MTLSTRFNLNGIIKITKFESTLYELKTINCKAIRIMFDK